MRNTAPIILGAEWQPYRVTSTEIPLRSERSPVGGSDDVVYVRDVQWPGHSVGLVRRRGSPAPAIVVMSVITALGLWKLWEIAGLLLVAAMRLEAG